MMKKALSIILSLTLLFSSVIILASCGNSFQLPQAPNGYLWYEDSDIYFAYPEILEKTESGNYVQLSPKEGGNNITVAKGTYNSTFDNMTVETFREHLKPGLTQAGLTITNEKVTHNEEKGFDIAIVTYDVSAQQIEMEQTLFMFRVNNYIYTLTVTSISEAEEMIETLFETLNVK